MSLILLPINFITLGWVESLVFYLMYVCFYPFSSDCVLVNYNKVVCCCWLNAYLLN